MEFKHESNRIYLENEEGELIAEVTFPTIKDNVVDINHTYVDDSLRGQGVAGIMMQEVADKLKDEGKKAQLTCSYAIAWFKKHSDYTDLVSK